MSDPVMRAAAVTAWAFNKNRAPSQLFDEGEKSELSPSQMSGGYLKVGDDDRNKTYEARDMSSTFYVNVGLEDDRLFFERSGNEHRVTDTETDNKYVVSVGDHEVEIKGVEGTELQTTMEVY